MFFFPFSTDAPLYYIPFGTVGLIVVNTVIFWFTLQDPRGMEPWILEFGHGLHPLQWVTCNFLHGGIMHLVGNMFYLWGFGLVVEGKLGWRRFLPLYLAIGAIYAAICQIAMLGARGGPPGAVGASGVIYGLLAIALVWAPRNEMNCFYFIGLWAGTREVAITGFATTYLILQGAFAWFTNFAMSSAMLHLTGAAIGFAFGVALLKLGWVDCEGWDLFAVMQDRVGRQPEKAAAEEPDDPEPKPIKLDEQFEDFLTGALRNRLRTGDAAGAAEFYSKQRALHPQWLLPAVDLLSLIQTLHKQQLWLPSVGPMTDYLRQYPENSSRMRLKLAQILIEIEHRPAGALKLLAKFGPTELPAELQIMRVKLTARAAQARDAAEHFELADGADV